MPNLKEIATNSLCSQGPAELLWLLNKVQTTRPKVIVEIGVHLGHSLKAWQDAFEPEVLIGIDNETNETLERYLSSGDLVAYVIHGDSHDHRTGVELVEALHGREIDFLFIDGDHMYEGVKNDFQMYAPLVRKGGIIAFDDMDLFDNPSVEVYKLWEEVVKRWPTQTESLHDDSNGIGVLYL